MTLNLAEQLPLLMPIAIEWAEAQAHDALTRGIPLKPLGLALAQRVGVVSPEHIRVAVVPELPLPADPSLRVAANQLGLLGPGMDGLTLGYAVFVRAGRDADPKLLSHEFRHVRQFEAMGSIAAFLQVYLPQLVAFGYGDAPFEVDARAHEIHGA